MIHQVVARRKESVLNQEKGKPLFVQVLVKFVMIGKVLIIKLLFQNCDTSMLGSLSWSTIQHAVITSKSNLEQNTKKPVRMEDVPFR